MKKVSILLAIVVMVGLSVTGSAYGRVYWVCHENPTTGIGDWFYTAGTLGQADYRTNWNKAADSSGAWVMPDITDGVVMQNGDIGGHAFIQNGSYTPLDMGLNKPRIGYCGTGSQFSGGDGDITMTADVTFSASGYAPTGEPAGIGGIKLGWGRPHSAVNPSTFIQTTGRVYVDWMDVGYSYEADVGSGMTNCGDGEYILSGDALFQACFRDNRSYQNGEIGYTGRGLLRLEGDGVTFLLKGNGFEQSANSRTEFKMSATGGISTINLTNSTVAVDVDYRGTLAQTSRFFFKEI